MVRLSAEVSAEHKNNLCFIIFYMRLNDDQKTVAAMDVLVPKVCMAVTGLLNQEFCRHFYFWTVYIWFAP
jgi:hypothetical protein